MTPEQKKKKLERFNKRNDEKSEKARASWIKHQDKMMTAVEEHKKAVANAKPFVPGPIVKAHPKSKTDTRPRNQKAREEQNVGDDPTLSLQISGEDNGNP